MWGRRLPDDEILITRRQLGRARSDMSYDVAGLGLGGEKKGKRKMYLYVGVALGADGRAPAGTLIAHKRTKKVSRLDDNIGLTTAGLVGDLQVLARYITAEVELYKLKRGIAMPVEACATLTANILSGSRFYPYWVQLVIGGWDRSGGHVFSLDAAGGSLPDKVVSSGSGSPYGDGGLEDH